MADYTEKSGEQEVQLLKNIVTLYAVPVSQLGEQEVQLLRQWLLRSAALAP